MRELTVAKNLTAGVSNTVYTVPKGCKAIATLLFISNHTGSTKAITASWYDKSDNDVVDIVASKALASKEYLQFADGRMVMDEYDELRCTPEASSSFSVIFTVEIHQNTSYQNGS